MKDWKRRKKTNSGTRKEYQNGIYQTCIVQWMRYRIYIVYYIVPYKLYEYNIYVERFFSPIYTPLTDQHLPAHWRVCLCKSWGWLNGKK